jgi:peptide/nickel transport system substrate-binding protein
LVGGGLGCLSLASSCALPGRQSSGATSSAALRATPGGVVVYGQSSLISNTLPYPSSASTNLFKWAIFNPLVSLDDRKQPVPVLAESWSMSADRLTVTFKLRGGVKFHSGRPFTADEARWSIAYAQDLRNGAQSGSELRAVQLRAVDASTLEMKLSDVMPHLFSLLTDVMIVDPQSDLTNKAAGTGAFRVDAFAPGVEMRLVRNDRYWRPDRPHLDAFIIKNLSRGASGTVDLESGGVDIVGVPASEVRRLHAEPGIAVEVVPSTGNFELLLNAADRPLNDKRVRQAIDLSLDRKRLSETLLYDLAPPTYVMWPTSSPVWDASMDIGVFNLEKARGLLVSAGYGNGFETRLQVPSTYSEEVLFAQIVQADLAKIGISSSVELLDTPLASAVMAQATFPALLLYAYAYADVDPALAFTNFAFRSSGNASRFHSDQYTEMVDAARREPDSEKRIALYRQIGAYVKDQAFVLPLANSIVAYAMRSSVHGFVRQPLFTVPVPEDLWQG